MRSYHVDQRRPQPTPLEPLAVPEAVAARLLGVSPRSLWQLRHDGRGPRHAMVGGSVRYRIEELHRWLAERQAATTEGGAA
jgi:predicted DNA-binding transcriptional regulator AlpA